ncbi:MAG: signal peptidase I [Ignisphaera sp.]
MNLKRVAIILENIFLIFLVVLLLYINIAYYVFGYVTLAIVKGQSMFPILRENDLVVILPNKNVALGDVVIFRNDRDEYVIHRVIAIAVCEDNSRLYITKGDNNRLVDSVSWGIALRISKICRTKNVYIFEGFEPYVKQAYDKDYIRGIPEERIIGKALSLFNMVVKITGIPSLRP